MENEDISIDIAFPGDNSNWIGSMVDIALKHNIDTLKIAVSTNVGETITAKVDKNLINSIKKKKEELKKNN